MTSNKTSYSEQHQFLQQIHEPWHVISNNVAFLQV